MSQIRDAFFQTSKKVPSVLETIPGLESQVEVRALSRGDRSDYSAFCAEVKDPSLRDAKMAILSCFDPNTKNRVFSDDDLELLAEDYYRLQAVVEKAAKLSSGEPLTGKVG